MVLLGNPCPVSFDTGIAFSGLFGTVCPGLAADWLALKPGGGVTNGPWDDGTVDCNCWEEEDGGGNDGAVLGNLAAIERAPGGGAVPTLTPVGGITVCCP